MFTKSLTQNIFLTEWLESKSNESVISVRGAVGRLKQLRASNNPEHSAWRLSTLFESLESERVVVIIS